MSQEIINSGNTQLYNNIFCNFVPTNNGFNTCTNCNFDVTNATKTSTQDGSQDCLNSCSSQSNCVAYSYNNSNGSCSEYSTFPNQINTANGIDSGYSLNFPYDYTTLSSQQQNNVQVKCGDQYLNNYYINNNNVEIADCITISNSGSNTLLDVDPECLYNIYQENGIQTNVVNESTYQENSSYSPKSKSDPTIDTYMAEYDAYITTNVQLTNLSPQGTNTNNLNSYNQTYKDSMEKTFDPVLKSDMKVINSIGIIEKFDNNKLNTNNTLLFIILIVLIIIILFYVFRKK